MPTSSDPEGLRDLAMVRSLPEVTVVLRDALLLVETGSTGVPPLVEPMAAMFDPAAAEIWPWKFRFAVPPTAIGPGMVQL